MPWWTALSKAGKIGKASFFWSSTAHPTQLSHSSEKWVHLLQLSKPKGRDGERIEGGRKKSDSLICARNLPAARASGGYKKGCLRNWKNLPDLQLLPGWVDIKCKLTWGVDIDAFCSGLDEV